METAWQPYRRSHAFPISPRATRRRKTEIESIGCYRSRRVIVRAKHKLHDVSAVTIAIVV
jgi:hypothetical protein